MQVHTFTNIIQRMQVHASLNFPQIYLLFVNIASLKIMTREKNCTLIDLILIRITLVATKHLRPGK